MEVECIKSKNPNLRLGKQGTNEQGLKITQRSFNILNTIIPFLPHYLHETC